jgi:hypothetical protein
MRALITVASAVVVAFALYGTADARTCRDIGAEGYTPTNIHARNTTCRVARRVATRVAKVPTFGGCIGAGRNGLFIHEPCRRLGYRCHGSDRGLGIRVRCARWHKRIRFDLG